MKVYKMRMYRIIYCLTVALTLFGVSAAPTPILVEDIETPDLVAAEEEADECLACHTDKDTLIRTAKVEEAVDHENEGEG